MYACLTGVAIGSTAAGCLYELYDSSNMFLVFGVLLLSTFILSFANKHVGKFLRLP
jgi:predicted MFS family arabinose efflux permease